MAGSPGGVSGPAARLAPAAAARLRLLGTIAEERGQGAWLVGGPVRDLLLEAGTVDLDVVVEGDGLAFARRAAARLGAGVQEYPRFHTGTLTLPDLDRVDVATARAETYPRPAALPEVSPAAIAADLGRRDFSINAMAMAITPARFGEMLDPHAGAADLAAGRLRILHAGSFLDDPTRLLRMARFAARFGFVPDAATREAMAGALAARIFDFLSADRLREEVFHGLFESEPAAVFSRLRDWNLLEAVLPGARPEGTFAGEVEAMKHVVALVEKGPTWDPAVACLLLLLRHASPEERGEAGRRLNLSVAARDALVRLGGMGELVAALEAAARPSQVRSVLGSASLELQLAALVLLPTPAARERMLDVLRGARESRPHLTGDDLMAMGFAPGPGLQRMLEALRRAKMDGETPTREAEEAFIRGHFQPPLGEVVS